MTAEQAQALMRLTSRRETCKNCSIRFDPFGLPDGYIEVEFVDGFVCGIAPSGDVSS